MFLQVSVILSTGGSASVHAGRPPCQGDPLPRRPLCQGDPPTRETPLPGRPPSRPTPKGEIEGDQVQAHTQGGNSGRSDPVPHPRGKLRESDPGPHPRGEFRGIRSRPTSKGEIQGDQDQTPHMTTAADGTHPTGICTPLKYHFITTNKNDSKSFFIVMYFIFVILLQC